MASLLFVSWLAAAGPEAPPVPVEEVASQGRQIEAQYAKAKREAEAFEKDDPEKYKKMFSECLNSRDRAMDKLRKTTPRFCLWAARIESAPGPVLSRADIGEMLTKIPSQKPGFFILSAAVVVPLDHIMKMDPVGLTYMPPGGEGIAKVAFQDLPPSIISYLGWTPAIAELFLKGETLPAPANAGTSPTAASSPAPSATSTIQKKIRAYARTQYPDDFGMQKYLVDLNQEASLKLGDLLINGVQGMPKSVFDQIFHKAFQSTEEGNYDMLLYRMEMQIKAWRELQ